METGGGGGTLEPLVLFTRLQEYASVLADAAFVLRIAPMVGRATQTPGGFNVVADLCIFFETGNRRGNL